MDLKAKGAALVTVHCQRRVKVSDLISIFFFLPSLSSEVLKVQSVKLK